MSLGLPQSQLSDFTQLPIQGAAPAEMGGGRPGRTWSCRTHPGYGQEPSQAGLGSAA